MPRHEKITQSTSVLTDPFFMYLLFPSEKLSRDYITVTSIDRQDNFEIINFPKCMSPLYMQIIDTRCIHALINSAKLIFTNSSHHFRVGCLIHDYAKKLYMFR